jgi:hypothetical protein
MSDMEQVPQEKPLFDRNAQARMYGEYYGMVQKDGEDDSDYRSRVAGELRRQGKLIEAHEAFSGRRWNDPEQGIAGPTAGIIGAVAQSLKGFEYSPRDPERQIGDDIAAGVVISSGPSRGEATIRMLFDTLGPAGAMDMLDAMSRPIPPKI